MKPPYAIGSVPSLSGHAIAYRWRSLPRVRRHRASKPQGSFERVLPWQITMDQLIFASLSHTHYWYEVGMLKVPAVNSANSTRNGIVYPSLLILVTSSILYRTAGIIFLLFIGTPYITFYILIKPCTINTCFRFLVSPVLSTCPLHTNSGRGKERRILIGPWRPAKAALVRNYLEIYWPRAGGLSAVNAIGTQLRYYPINSGLTRWRMAVITK